MRSDADGRCAMRSHAPAAACTIRHGSRREINPPRETQEISMVEHMPRRETPTISTGASRECPGSICKRAATARSDLGKNGPAERRGRSTLTVWQ